MKANSSIQSSFPFQSYSYRLHNTPSHRFAWTPTRLFRQARSSVGREALFARPSRSIQPFTTQQDSITRLQAGSQEFLPREHRWRPHVPHARQHELDVAAVLFIPADGKAASFTSITSGESPKTTRFVSSLLLRPNTLTRIAFVAMNVGVARPRHHSHGFETNRRSFVQGSGRWQLLPNWNSRLVTGLWNNDGSLCIHQRT